MPRLRYLRFLMLPEAKAGGTVNVSTRPSSNVVMLPVCAAEDCRNSFEPRWRNQRYCSPRCRSRQTSRELRRRVKDLPDPRVTTTDNGERYYVVACAGWPINPLTEGRSGNRDASVSYSILDSAWGDREIRRYVPGDLKSAQCYRRAIDECIRLNADERAWERQEGAYA